MLIVFYLFIYYKETRTRNIFGRAQFISKNTKASQLKQTTLFISIKTDTESELLNEVINVFADLLWLFLLEKMSYPFHYNHLFQKGYIFFEATIVYMVLETRNIVEKVQIANNKLSWNCDW